MNYDMVIRVTYHHLIQNLAVNQAVVIYPV